MASPSDTAALDRVRGLGAAQVVDYLRRHPDFLATHPELLRVLTPPSRATGDGVVDFQTHIIERLRRESAALKRHHDALVASGRATLSDQRQVHAAVIAMLGATTFEQLIEVVTTDFLRALRLDVVTLCVEGDGESRRRCLATGIRCVPPGAVDSVLGPDRDLLTGRDHAGDAHLFGAGAGLARSTALARIRLGPGAPACVLALGSRDDGRFQPGHGAELLGFLAGALEHCLRAWLDLPT